MTKIVIFGASSQGRVVLEILRAQRRREIAGFLDDDPAKHGCAMDGLPVLGNLAWVLAQPATAFAAIVAVGNNDARMAVSAKLRTHGVILVNAIHPSAVVMGGVELETNILIGAGAIVVTGARVEEDAVINTAASVDHDSTIARGAYLAPGVHTAGCVKVGRGAFVGAGAILGPGVDIGEGTVIGAGSVVLHDVPARVMAYGTPARVVHALSGPVNWQAILGGQ